MKQIAAGSGARAARTVSRDASPVGIVGFGLLGEALAQRLLAGGWPLLARDPAPARRERMAAIGVAPADEQTIAARAGCVLLAVYDAAQVRDALHGLAAGAPPGKRLPVVCTTTLSSGDAEDLARAHAAGPLEFIAMPISGSSQQVLEGSALALLGSGAPAPDGVQAVVHALCPQQLLLADGGAAARAKLVINLVLELNRAALAEGLTLARAFGLDLEIAERALRRSAAASRVMDRQAPKMRSADFRPDARLAQSLKDLDAVLAEGRARYLPLGAALRDLLRCSVEAGDGALDSAAIVLELQRRATGLVEAQPC